MQPIVIGHRGAPGYRPEHTLASYELAARLGADHIEPDLVATADGVLVARHEPEIGTTTDVALRPEFADRRTIRVIDGTPHAGWFVDDFTLVELRTLRAVERIPALRRASTRYDRRFVVPTFTDVLALRERLSHELGRAIGVYPEAKNPSYFAVRGIPLAPALVAELDAAGMNRRDAPVFVQCFEPGTLRALRRDVEVPLVQLVGGADAPVDLVAAGDPRTYADLVSPGGLARVAEYADVVAPDKERVIPRAPDGTLGAPTTLVADAHAAGLLVHAWTFRDENAFLPADLRSEGPAYDLGDAFAEYDAFLRAGVDGVFSDHPDTAVAARDGRLARV